MVRAPHLVASQYPSRPAPTERDTPHPTRDRMTVSNQNDRHQPRLSAAQQARLRLAKNRLEEAREMDPSSAPAAELLLTIGRLASALEDVIALAEGSPESPHGVDRGEREA